MMRGRRSREQMGRGDEGETADYAREVEGSARQRNGEQMGRGRWMMMEDDGGQAGCSRDG